MSEELDQQADQHPRCRLCEERKRKRNVFNTIPWCPGSGIPCYDFGPQEEKRLRRQQLRASLLFQDMQVAGTGEGDNLTLAQERVYDVLRAREEKDVEERRISARLAQQHAIDFNRQPPVTAEEDETTRPSHEQERLQQKAKRGVASRKYPITFTAARQGKERAGKHGPPLDSFMQCWKQNKLVTQDLINAMHPLAASSDALHDLIDVLARDAASSSADKGAIQNAFALKKQSTDC
eukprot:753021-Hanusia_phi.AAC.1